MKYRIKSLNLLKSVMTYWLVVYEPYQEYNLSFWLWLQVTNAESKTVREDGLLEYHNILRNAGYFKILSYIESLHI